MGLLHHPFWLQLVFRHFLGINFQTFANYFVWLRITDKGTVPEMRIWSILLIKSDLKWCIFVFIDRILFWNMTKMDFLTFNTYKWKGTSGEGLSVCVTWYLVPNCCVWLLCTGNRCSDNADYATVHIQWICVPEYISPGWRVAFAWLRADNMPPATTKAEKKKQLWGIKITVNVTRSYCQMWSLYFSVKVMVKVNHLMSATDRQTFPMNRSIQGTYERTSIPLYRK